MPETERKHRLLRAALQAAGLHPVAVTASTPTLYGEKISGGDAPAAAGTRDEATNSLPYIGQRGRGLLQAARRFVSHPLLLLLVGALATQQLASAYQDRQKELDLKTGLEAEISEKTTGFIMRQEVAHYGREVAREISAADIGAETIKSYERWQIDVAAIEAKLRVWFPTHPELGREWNELSDVLLATRNQLRTYARTGKKEWLTGLIEEARAIRARDPYASPRRDLNLGVRDMAAGKGVSGVGIWYVLRDELFDRRDRLLRRILAAEMKVS